MITVFSHCKYCNPLEMFHQYLFNICDLSSLQSGFEEYAFYIDGNIFLLVKIYSFVWFVMTVCNCFMEYEVLYLVNDIIWWDTFLR